MGEVVKEVEKKENSKHRVLNFKVKGVGFSIPMNKKSLAVAGGLLGLGGVGVYFDVITWEQVASIFAFFI